MVIDRALKKNYFKKYYSNFFSKIITLWMMGKFILDIGLAVLIGIAVVLIMIYLSTHSIVDMLNY